MTTRTTEDEVRGDAPVVARVPVDDRIAERRRQVREERRRRRLRRTVTVAIALVVLAVLVAVERSPLVELAEVRIEGVDRLDEATVREAADLTLGTSTLRLRLGAVEDRVTALPLVASASADRVDPLTIRVTVVEREPAVVLVAGEEGRLVDATGTVIAAGLEEGLLQVALPAGAALPAPGDVLTAGAGEAVEVVTGIPGPLLATVARVEVTDADEVDLLLADGVRVRVGDASRLDEKARALGAVLEDLRDTQVAVIDVRAPSTPIVSR
ncbi:MAG: cell division protein FtsQ/DivIB [Actinomycetes bacterium]